MVANPEVDQVISAGLGELMFSAQQSVSRTVQCNVLSSIVLTYYSESNGFLRFPFYVNGLNGTQSIYTTTKT